MLPGYCTGSRLKHTPSLSEKEAYLACKFVLRGRLLVWHTSKVYRGALREQRPVDAVFVLSVYFIIAHQYLTERSLYTLFRLE